MWFVFDWKQHILQNGRNDVIYMPKFPWEHDFQFVGLVRLLYNSLHELFELLLKLSVLEFIAVSLLLEATNINSFEVLGQLQMRWDWNIFYYVLHEILTESIATLKLHKFLQLTAFVELVYKKNATWFAICDCFIASQVDDKFVLDFVSSALQRLRILPLFRRLFDLTKSDITLK